MARVVVAVVFVCACVVAAGARAQAGQWLTTPQVLKDFFASSARVSYVDVDSAALKARGIASAKAKHHVYVGYGKDGAVSGFAVIDDEVGQHEPISFAVLVGTDLRVRRVEVMAYREAYGAEIRAPRYLSQFTGKGRDDVEQKGGGVDAISGATLSSRSTVTLVRRALALAALAQQQLPPTPASAAPTTTVPTTTTPAATPTPTPAP